jgi:NCS1 family nucleobase:cation symporter-1
MSASDMATGTDFEHAAFEGNPRFAVEGHGFDFIPEAERNLSLRSLGLFWLGTNFYLFNFVIGVLAIGLGLEVWQALLAVALGSLTYILVALGSLAGARSGLPTVTVARGAFGINANRANATLGWLDSVLFEALNVVFAVFATTALFVELGWDDPGDAGKVLGLVAVYTLAILVATLGHATVVWLQRIFGVFLGVVMLTVLAFTVGDIDFSAGPAGASEVSGSFGIFLLAAGVIASGGLAYMVTPCDFSRYLPSRTASSAHFWTVLATAGGAALFLGFMGVVLAAQADLTDPVAGVEPLIPGWLYIVFVVSVIGGSVGNCVISLYNSGLTLQATGVPLRRYQATLLDSVVAGALIIYILFVKEDFQSTLNDILSLLLVWVGPFGAIWLTDAALRRWYYNADEIHSNSGGRYFGRGGFRIEAIVALLAGMLVAFLSMNAPVNQGPLSSALFSDGDLSWLLGPAVGAGVYLLLAARGVRSEEARASSIEDTAGTIRGERELVTVEE